MSNTSKPRRQARKNAKVAAAVETEQTTIRTLKQYPNKRWLLGQDADGNAVKVLVPLRMSDKLAGKALPVTKEVDEAGEKYYKYAP